MTPRVRESTETENALGHMAVGSRAAILQTRYHHFLVQIPSPPHSRLYSVVWEPHVKKDKVLLEAVQLQATMMAGKQWKENSVSLNQRFEHSSLESRRKYFKLSQVFKWVYLLSHRLFFTAS